MATGNSSLAAIEAQILRLLWQKIEVAPTAISYWEFLRLLEDHDWTGGWSDDGEVYRRYSRRTELLQEARENLGSRGRRAYDHVSDGGSAEDLHAPEVWLAELGAVMKTQDGMATEDGPSHATAHPIYIVTEARRIYGTDPTWQDQDGEEETEEGELVSYTVERCPVEGAVALTRAGIEEYLACNRHNLQDPEIFVASCRCAEMRRLQAALMEVAP